MPELPEVEVARRGIAARLHGARVLAVRCGKPLRWPLGCAPESLLGSRLGEITRRGKYLWLPLQRDGSAAAGADGGLLLHLGMSGSLALHDAPPEAAAHAHFDLTTSQGTLRLTDPRRFGAVVWSSAIDAAPAAALLSRLGAEPFDPAFTAHSLYAACRRRKTSIKALLLGGQVIVGAGNIYACEALFDAGIDPRTRCDRLSLARCDRLLAALRHTLSRALALGGSTLRDFSDAHGNAGAFQQQARVYGREGQACQRCGATLRRIVQAQRSTYLCPGCQRRS
ncbi:MAG TPA: bifunctional DNA-formamidopyrimidine glycosylase/DNA-(apurinic or apyrimidinic site) lyase [Rubrivivax sp.]|nr:bifunctional DNA-formamidopyrimidine glycosylase/DNA-(apurinic or apyrimidinic site) lyase [Rubrivivax sp.]HPO19115.1 bifunctional DNA-formamidopyrimidine glycosylase/DNA-(apurinic or apyrimidinic site) lyase [Rubrivivax sp.]